MSDSSIFGLEISERLARAVERETPAHVAIHCDGLSANGHGNVLIEHCHFLVDELHVIHITLIAPPELQIESAPLQNAKISFVSPNGGRQEILDAVKNLATSKITGRLNGKSVDEELFRRFLSTNGTPDPDLIIKTNGELRVGNSLIWQMAYSEFWVIDKPWYKLDRCDLLTAIEAYQNRERRFGQVLNTV